MWAVSEGTSVLPYASVEAMAPAEGSLNADPDAPLLVEATLLWGRDTLDVRHLAVRPELRVRDLGMEVPGCADLLLGTTDDAGSFRLKLPNGALVPDGCRMTLRIGRTMLRLAVVADDAVRLPRARLGTRAALGIVGAAALHLTVLGLMAHSRVDEGASEQAARETMQRMVSAAEDRALAELAAAQEKTRVETSPGMSARTPDKEQAAAGSVSKQTETAARMRTTKGEDRRAQKPEREEVATFGILALLAGAEAGAHVGSSAFAAESGPSAMGNIFGQTIDDAAGMGGLGLTGPGQGGGGYGAGVKLASIGTIGHASGLGDASGLGAGARPKPREHDVRSFTWVMSGGAGTQVNGRLPPESIQRVVRQSFGRLRACYAAGLERNPGLEGRATVKFVIDREGQVALAAPSSDSTIGDASVLRCVTRAYESMVFPKPEGGIVTVVYPVVFTRTSP
jgi:hypothetical protein